MPLAHIYILEGRNEVQKHAIIEKVTDALCEAVGAPRDTVRIVITETPKANWGIGGKSAKELGR